MTAFAFRERRRRRHEQARRRSDGWLVGGARGSACAPASACATRAERAGYRVTRVDVGRDIATVLRTLKPDVALNVLHGRPGEDGTLQGILEILGIPYSHSGVMASAVAMQKDVAKVRDEGRRRAGAGGHGGVPAGAPPKGIRCRGPTCSSRSPKGSSVGVFIVTEQHAHPPQELTREDWAFGEPLLVERYIPGKELTCAVMGDKALDVIEIVAATRFYDYEAKYAPGRL